MSWIAVFSLLFAWAAMTIAATLLIAFVLRPRIPVLRRWDPVLPAVFAAGMLVSVWALWPTSCASQDSDPPVLTCGPLVNVTESVADVGSVPLAVGVGVVIASVGAAVMKRYADGAGGSGNATDRPTRR